MPNDVLRAVEQLGGKLPKSEIKKNPQGFDYVDPVYILDRLNSIFGFDGWSAETIAQPHIVEKFTREKRKDSTTVTNHVAVVACTVRVHAMGIYRDGVGMGTADAHIDAFAGSLETAFKGAATDALKRACITLGDVFGLTLYERDATKRAEGIDSTPAAGKAGAGKTGEPTPQQVGAKVHEYVQAVAAAKGDETKLATIREQLKSEPPAVRKAVTDAMKSSEREPGDEGEGPSERPATSTLKFKFGRDKDTPLSELDGSSLEWYLGKLNGDLGDESKSRWHDKTRQDIAAIEAEMAWRAQDEAA